IVVTVDYVKSVLGVFDLASHTPEIRKFAELADTTPIVFAPADRGVVTCCRDGKFVEVAPSTGIARDIELCKGATWIVRGGDELFHVAIHEEDGNLRAEALRPPSCEPFADWVVPKQAIASGIPRCTATRCVLITANGEQFWIFRKDLHGAAI